MACELTLAQVLEATAGQSLSQVEKAFVGVGTDTRKNLKHQIFVALKGENHDAHAFLAQAVSQGAASLIIDDEKFVTDELKNKVTLIKVPDTLLALQNLARYWRSKLSAKVIAITGSNGKTSTKEFAAAVLSAQFKVHYSKGSFNNHWGVPLTLLEASLSDEAVIVEMGMNHAGELTKLSKIATPDIVVCTNVGRAHIGNFGGSSQAIADAKEEIYLANPKAIKVFNYDNEFTLKMFNRVSKLQGAERTIVFSSFSAGAEVNLRGSKMGLDGLEIIGQIGGVKGEAHVPVFGRQNVANIMAASAIAVVMKMEPEKIWAALPRCKGQWGRNQVVRLVNGATVIFDAYNANPDSTGILIKNLFELNVADDGRKIAVLGDMLELGNDAEKYHRDLGETIGNTDVAMVWFIGRFAKAFESGLRKSSSNMGLTSSPAFDPIVAQGVLSTLKSADLIVMKGSRGAKLEKVMQNWLPSFSSNYS
jgi:UDP-N-acetylmuramoyl-tripeptide--D-alanyl-D-alanine ligase